MTKKITKKEYAQKAYDLMKAIPRDKNSNPLTLEGAIRSVILKSPDMFHAAGGQGCWSRDFGMDDL